jgi:hypothetical protein
MPTKTEVSSGSMEATHVQDRELLELAAKAAGLRIDFEDALEFGSRADLRYFDDETGDFWNPLVSDGDALRLAVKLRLEVMVTDVGAVVKPHGRIGEVIPEWSDSERNGNNHAAAVRRAIVRAAAALTRATGEAA